MRYRRLLFSFLVLVLLLNGGAIGYYLLYSGKHEYIDCLYRTILIVTTVNEPWPKESSDLELGRRLQAYTVILLISGMGVVLYTVSSLAAFIIEADIRRGFRKRKVRKLIDGLRDHIIICGGGETGRRLLAELELLRERFVVIEIDEARAEALSTEKAGVPIVHGDATDDDVLQRCGVSRARGVIAALPSDSQNLFLVFSARQLNPHIRIVARSIDPSTDRKLRQAGADVIVAANTIVANRMVSALVRPQVLTFMDSLLRDPNSRSRMEEVVIEPGSSLDGRTLEESHIGARTGLLVLAVQPGGEEEFRCNPAAGERLEAGSKLVVLGQVDAFPELRRMALSAG